MPSGDQNPSSPWFPSEILLQIARACLWNFEDDELWFDLARVSRLFRDVVETYAVTSGHSRLALCTKLETRRSRPGICQIRVQQFMRMGGSDDYEFWQPLKLSHIERVDQRRAVFRSRPQDVDFNTDPPPKPNVRIHVPETITLQETRREHLPLRPPILVDLVALTPTRGTHAENEPRGSFGGYSLHGARETVERSSPVVVEITYDWRYIWTVKCAFVRRESIDAEKRKRK